MNQRTLLFLIADTGAGHRSAANAIRNAITLISQQEREEWLARWQQAPGESAEMLTPPTYRIEIVDVFEEYSHFPLRGAMKLYGPAIRYNPKLYGQIFHISNQPRRILAAQTLATPLIHNGLLRLITSVQPDVIVSIHPLLNAVTLQVLRDLKLPIPFITVVTDLVSIHHSWFARGADAYIVPTEYARQLYMQRGFDPERVHMLGMPIDPKFTHPMASKEDLRRKLELDPTIPVVLLVGGGEGTRGLHTSVRAISQARLPVQLLIITGRNKRLYAQLQRMRSSLRVPARVMGFVQNMPEMMHASDVIVTKAGPGTISEALACGLPIVLNSYVPGQEKGNVDYVIDNGVGVLAQDSVELVDELRRLLKPGSPVLQQQLTNARLISRPYASFDIAKHILSYLPPPGKYGVWLRGVSSRRRRQMSGRLRSATPIRDLSGKLPGLRRRLPFKERSLIPHLRRTPFRRSLTQSRTRSTDTHA